MKRSRKRLFVASTIVLVAVLPLVLKSRRPVDGEKIQNALPPPPLQRVIHFPSDRSLGDLHFRKWELESFTPLTAYFDGKSPAIYLQGWDAPALPMGNPGITPARGSIAVPAGQQVLLLLSDPEAVPFLDTLEPDDLQAVCFTGDFRPPSFKIDREVISHLTRLTGLRNLILAFCNDLSTDTYAAIADLSFLRGVGIHGAPSNTEAFHELTRITGLETLELNFPPVESIMSQLKDFPRLQRLSIGVPPNGEWRSSSPTAPLAHLESLTKLTALAFNAPGLGNDELSHLRNMVHLEKLSINSGRIDDDGLQYLSQMSSMRILRLASQNIRGTGLKHLAGMQNLRTLDLMGNQIRGESLKPLGAMKSLHFLILGYNPIDDAGLPFLTGLAALERLSLDRTIISRHGHLRLQRALPHCRIQSPFTSSVPVPTPNDKQPLS